MTQFEWAPEDAADLIRRDRGRALRQGSPIILAAGLMALWLRTTAPSWAAVFLGMCVAWALSLATQMKSLRSRWRALEMGSMQLDCSDTGLTWVASYGTRVLRWEETKVQQLGATWILLIRGHEAAFIPGRCVNADDEKLLRERMEAPK